MRGIGFAVQVGLAFRLQNQPLCEEKPVFPLESHGGASLLTDIERRFGVKPVRCEPLDAERRPGARRALAKILACSSLHAPSSREDTVPQQSGVPRLPAATHPSPPPPDPR